MKKLSLAIVVAMSITACGGGGGSSSLTQTPKVTKISTTNAVQITQSVNSSMADMNIMQGMTVDYSQQAIATVNAFGQQKSAAVTRTIYCGATPNVDSGNGLIDMSYDFTFTSVSVDFAFLECQYSETVFVNGDYALDAEGNFLDIAAGNAMGGIRFTSTVTDLNVVNVIEGTDTRLNGIWAHELIQTDLGYQLDFTADVTLTTVTATKELINWQQLTEIDTNLSQLNIDITGQFKSSDLTGTLSVTTVESLLYQLPVNPQAGNVLGRAGPTIVSGQFKISATDGSSVLVTIIDAQSAQLDIDANGDGVIDVTRIVALSDLGIGDLIPNSSLIN